MGIRILDNTNYTHIYFGNERFKIATNNDRAFQSFDWWIEGGYGYDYIELYIDNPFDFPLYLKLSNRSYNPATGNPYNIFNADTSEDGVAINSDDLYNGTINWITVIPPRQTICVFSYSFNGAEITAAYLGGVTVFYEGKNEYYALATPEY